MAFKKAFCLLSFIKLHIYVFIVWNAKELSMISINLDFYILGNGSKKITFFLNSSKIQWLQF